mmetsp:Transcript_14903/g.35368  ORF Transcript_14903/g.35368 Transcript_14903/m.35368 type:complete len:305 (-) Transcript_14903:1173-2087(-)
MGGRARHRGQGAHRAALVRRPVRRQPDVHRAARALPHAAADHAALQHRPHARPGQQQRLAAPRGAGVHPAEWADQPACRGDVHRRDRALRHDLRRGRRHHRALQAPREHAHHRGHGGAAQPGRRRGGRRRGQPERGLRHAVGPAAQRHDRVHATRGLRARRRAAHAAARLGGPGSVRRRAGGSDGRQPGAARQQPGHRAAAAARDTAHPGGRRRHGRARDARARLWAQRHGRRLLAVHAARRGRRGACRRAARHRVGAPRAARRRHHRAAGPALRPPRRRGGLAVRRPRAAALARRRHRAGARA